MQQLIDLTPHMLLGIVPAVAEVRLLHIRRFDGSAVSSSQRDHRARLRAAGLRSNSPEAFKGIWLLTICLELTPILNDV